MYMSVIGLICNDRYGGEEERPALAAHFHLGRLYTKLLEGDPGDQLSCISASLENYRYVSEYVRRNPAARDGVGDAETEICEEMVSLLPARMEKIRARINC